MDGRGTRPEFKLVTGISTGGLIAPFAFLGPKYDATLKEFYTTISPKDVIEPRSFITGVLSDAMANNAPLWTLTRKSVTEELLKEIAAEYREGPLPDDRHRRHRRAPRDPLGHGQDCDLRGPKALDLFVSVMIASASLPAAFPPVMIDVEADGKRYQEMHVDGGIMAQVFAYPVGITAAGIDAATGTTRDRSLYVIRNARLDPGWAQVERQTMSIAGRAITSLIHSQGIGDLYRIHSTTQRDRVDFNLAFMPPSSISRIRRSSTTRTCASSTS